MRRYACLAIFAILLAGCTVGPNYKRPLVDVPPTFRAPEPLPPAEAASLADLKWFEVFKDDKLQDLIRKALVSNYDLRDAVTRVQAARANLGITRSYQYPNFAATGNVEINRLSRNGETPLPPRCCRTRIAISAAPCHSYSPLKSISGGSCGAPPKPPALIC